MPPIRLRYEPPQSDSATEKKSSAEKTVLHTLKNESIHDGFKFEWEFMTTKEIPRLRWKPRWGYFLVPEEEARLRPFYEHENPAAAFASDMLHVISFYAQIAIGKVHLYSAHILGYDVDAIRPLPSARRAEWEATHSDPEEEIRRAMRRAAGLPDPHRGPGPLQRVQEAWAGFTCRLRGGGGSPAVAAMPDGGAGAWRMPPPPRIGPDRLRGMEGGSWKDGRRVRTGN